MKTRRGIAIISVPLCVAPVGCGRDNNVSRDSSSTAGQPASGLGSGGNQTGSNTGVQGKTATGAGGAPWAVCAGQRVILERAKMPATARRRMEAPERTSGPEPR